MDSQSFVFNNLDSEKKRLTEPNLREEAGDITKDVQGTTPSQKKTFHSPIVSSLETTEGELDKIAEQISKHENQTSRCRFIKMPDTVKIKDEKDESNLK